MLKKLLYLFMGFFLLLIIGFGLYYVINRDSLNKDDGSSVIDDDASDVYVKKNDFNSRIIKEVNKVGNNDYLISPYSIEIALNMLRDGSVGNSKKQIDELISERSIKTFNIKNRISTANAAFIKNDYRKKVKSQYYEKLQSRYNADVLFDEFESPNVLNKWVNDKTYGMIPSLLNTIDPNFVMAIANATSIGVDWEYPFDCKNTKKEEFKKSDSTSIDASMMNKTFTYGVKYFTMDNAKGVVLPYKSYTESGDVSASDDGHLEFIAILPNDDVNSFIDGINSKTFSDIDDKSVVASDKINIKVSLPSFKYNYDYSGFKDGLINLGVSDVFDPNKANLSNMLDVSNVYVTDAIHKTYIDLNESGTKASAVTAFVIQKSSAIISEEKPKIIEIKFDKPFIYLIRDYESKELLFFGTVYNPNMWNGSTCK